MTGYRRGTPPVKAVAVLPQWQRQFFARHPDLLISVTVIRGLDMLIATEHPKEYARLKEQFGGE